MDHCLPRNVSYSSDMRGERGCRRPTPTLGDEGSTVNTRIHYALIVGFFLVILGLFCCIHFSSRFCIETDENNEKKHLNQADIIKKFSKVKKMVKEEDLVVGLDPEEGLATNYSVGKGRPQNHFLTLPTPGNVPDKFGKLERNIPNCCSICLSGYSPGATVVWSGNPNCPHAFHEDCILHWLLIKMVPTCPYCRRDFLDADAQSFLSLGYEEP